MMPLARVIIRVNYLCYQAQSAMYQTHQRDYKIGTPFSLLAYSVPGAFFDWMAFRMGVKYSFSIEVRPELDPEEQNPLPFFILPEEEIIPLGVLYYTLHLMTV